MARGHSLLEQGQGGRLHPRGHQSSKQPLVSTGRCVVYRIDRHSPTECLPFFCCPYRIRTERLVCFSCCLMNRRTDADSCLPPLVCSAFCAMLSLVCSVAGRAAPSTGTWLFFYLPCAMAETLSRICSPNRSRSSSSPRSEVRGRPMGNGLRSVRRKTRPLPSPVAGMEGDAHHTLSERMARSTCPAFNVMKGAVRIWRSADS